MTLPAPAAARPRRPRLALVGLGLLVGLAACGGSDTDSPAGGGAATGSAPAATAAAPGPAAPRTAPATTAAAAAGEDCGAAQAEVQAGVGVTGNVTSVEIVGQCTTASVQTSLGTTADDVDAALGICGIAAVQAYSHGVTTVNVVAADGKGLAIGIQGGECIPVSPG